MIHDFFNDRIRQKEMDPTKPVYATHFICYQVIRMLQEMSTFFKDSMLDIMESKFHPKKILT